MEPQNLIDWIGGSTIEPGHTVHSNSHCNALVENPFAWEEDSDSES